MPSFYAHYRFGSRCIQSLPPEVQRVVKQFRQLFDVGLHGPDIFFYHNIFFPDSASALARKIHQQTGADFFARVCKRLRLDPSEAAAAYLYGVLAHFCLDAVTHPFILKQTQDGSLGHAELETEFDRFLMQLDGKPQPNTFDCSPHMKLTPGECATVARFYGTNATTISASIRGMAASARILSMPNGPVRRFVEKGAGKRLRQHFMERTPNRRCVHLNEEMLSLFEEALEQYPSLVETLQAHLSHNAPLAGLLDADFNGSIT